MPEYRSKWTILTERQEEAQRRADVLAHQLEGLENTPCNLDCPACGTKLPTEADFAKHFEVRRFDEVNNHLNLGYCPNRTTKSA